MTLPSKHKSIKNILIHAENHIHQLKISQLLTQPNSKTFSISLQTIAQKYDASNTQTHRFSQKITSMQTKYYDSSLIYMENEIDFHDSSKYLKRYYSQEEFEGKIHMLSEYYKYHTDHPRIFLQQVQKVMTTFQEEKRELEYVKVREKIDEERQVNQQKNNPIQQKFNQNMKHIDSKKNLLHNDQKKIKKSQKLLKNIQLSYVDFENKPEKKLIIEKNSQQKQMKRKSSTNATLTSKQKTLQKSSSNNMRHMFSSNSQHHMSRETSKNDLKRVFTLKNAESKQIKNLQSKYTQIISELFKKKRSSSKATNINHKIEHGTNKNVEKAAKSIEINIDSQNRVHQNESAVVQSKEEQKIRQDKKITRSKSQATMNICKSNKLLKTFKAKINEKTIKLNSKPASNFSSKQTNAQKPEQHTKQLTLKRDKYSSNKSLRSQNHVMSQKPLKTVKTFQIAKKDLVIEHSSKNSSVQKDIIKGQQRQGVQQKKNHEKNDNKENQSNEIPVSKDKQRAKSYKPIMEFNSIYKRKQVLKKSQRQPKTVMMFGRVLKSKIRG